MLWSIMWSELHSYADHSDCPRQEAVAGHRPSRAANETESFRFGTRRTREHLRTLQIRAREESDRQGYSRRLPTADEFLAWEAEAAWPAE